MITWVHYNEDARRSRISELLKMINLNEIEKEFMESNILKESLIETNIKCQYQAILTLRTLVVDKHLKHKIHIQFDEEERIDSRNLLLCLIYLKTLNKNTQVLT